MTKNNSPSLVHDFVCWQFGQGSAGRFFSWSPPGSAMCQKLSGSLVESSGQYCLPTYLVLGCGCRLDSLSVRSLILKEAGPLVKVIHVAKPRFKGSSWWERRPGHIAKGHARMGGMTAAVSVKSLRVSEWTSETRSSEKVTNNFEAEGTSIRPPLDCFLVGWSWRAH